MASVTCRGDLHMDKLGPLNIITKIQPTVEISERCVDSGLSQPSSPEMDTPKIKRIDPPSYSPESPTHAGPRASSVANSAQHSRSASRSTARSRPPSRHSSFHSTRRPVVTASIVPVPPPRTTAHERRESLLALHRESCRLFEEQESADNIRPTLQRALSTTYRTRRESHTSSDIGYSAPPSPIASSQSSRRDYEYRESLGSAAASPPFYLRDRSNTLPSGTSMMEWTSDTTRRREYEKIDRSTRGVRGLWRRVAPRWCHRDSRVPFFEEGKTGREGSVRRFRMDLPDEESKSERDQSQAQFLDLHKNSDGYALRRWAYRRSKNYSQLALSPSIHRNLKMTPSSDIRHD
ncbi:uncharacterized protein N7477_004914 [Penicillium maclennaniae]|uniref:uncharacterized protein n=1 Tax=Penicillium maclennaniae TaxID=1343394 RepID=UPI00254047CF|nr:uncharacterized protein N7477_004914 [Penicillium maclennaniae]KAJ5674980.1 hypothetical protein N7477_004914 [Penicillium maclennaniae]